MAAGHAFTTFLCECSGSCIPVCPTECIRREVLPSGRAYTHVDRTACTDCGACAAVCPIDGGIFVPSFAARISSNELSEEDEKREDIVGALFRYARISLQIDSRLRHWLADCAARVTRLTDPTDPTTFLISEAIRGAREHARALDLFSREWTRARRDGGEMGQSYRLRLASAKQHSALLRDEVAESSHSAASPVTRLAAAAAAAACFGFRQGAPRAVEAVACAANDEMSAARARIAERQWQFERLILRVSPRLSRSLPMLPATD